MNTPKSLDTATSPDRPPENPRQGTVDSTTLTMVDIEHAPVQDDPRHWSPFRKVCQCQLPDLLTHLRICIDFESRVQNFSLFLISAASMIAGLAGNIQNRKSSRLGRFQLGPGERLPPSLYSRRGGNGRGAPCNKRAVQLELVVIHPHTRSNPASVVRNQ